MMILMMAGAGGGGTAVSSGEEAMLFFPLFCVTILDQAVGEEDVGTTIQEQRWMTRT